MSTLIQNKSTNSSLNGGSPSNKSLNSLTNTTNTSMPVGITTTTTATTTTTSSSLTPTNNNNSNINRHWSQKKHESVVASQNVETLNFLSKIRGGSDSGQFIYLDSTLISTNTNNDSFDTSTTSNSSSNNTSPQQLQHHQSNAIQMISGKLYPNEIILEIQGKKVSGFTLYDVISWLKQLTNTYQSITFRTVKSAKITKHDNMNNNNANSKLLLPLELRTYLDERFQKGSIDYDLQQIIRENVYMRTVPCTTRSPRPGEIHGQDYIFLNNDEFLEMEQNGDLLEYGVYNGFYYGTPKPPREPLKPQNNNIKFDQHNHQEQQSLMNNKRNNSLNDMNSVVNLTKQSRPKSIEITADLEQQQHNSNGNNNRLSSLGVISSSTNNTTSTYQQQLKSNQNIANTLVNEALQLSSPDNNNEKKEDIELIPYGWEKVEDPEYGTFYIDHINKQTTYENPFLQQQLQQQHSSMKTFKPSSSASTTPQPTPTSTLLHQQQQQQENSPVLTTSATPQTTKRNIYFTQNPNELKGDFLKTSLLKTAQGFGFTIIGANETSEDFLQIKYIVPDGAASRDGRLKQGDVLVYVNNECVLGYTHQDVVEIFQSIPIGQQVDLTVCRGYPLSIDPNDPNIEIMPLSAINNNNKQQQQQQAPLASVDDMSSSTTIQQQPITAATLSKSEIHIEEFYLDDYEDLYASIVKGPKGFGFTIADDAQINHQKVKQILDRERCCNLVENDILLEINGINLNSYGHMQVVDVLKECPKGQETIIKLKRRKLTTNGNNNESTNHHQFNNKIITKTKSKSNQYLSTITTPPSTNATPTTKTKLSLPPYYWAPKPLRRSNSLSYSSSSTCSVSSLSFNSGATNGHTTTTNGINNEINNDFHHTTNPNQLAFNYERRSKTPNILQQSSSTTSHLQQQLISPTTTNGTFNPQLRSKTPTTDRLLFQHTLNNNNNNTGNDYIYLNGNNNNNIKKMPTPNTTPKSIINDNLYSTVNKMKQKQLEDNIILNNEIVTSPPQQHMPIYDSTTNLQHQRVIQNLNRFNQHQQQQQIQFNNNNINSNNVMNNSQHQLRSKTPGPDVIYFRNNNNNNNNATTKSTTMLPNQYSSNTMNNRSKTPTADMLYYPTNLIKRGGNENIYTNTNGIVNGVQMDDYILESNQQIISDVDGNNYIEMIIDLYKQESGFGFRIVGGEEEGSQVAIGYIVQGGAAHLDGRLRPNDEIITIDSECVLGATHRRVVQLMAIAGLNRKVKLMIRRRINMPPALPVQQQRPVSRQQQHQQQAYPYTITLFRNGNEGFGFVIISTINKTGPSIGKIVENSPAERCKRLNIGDRILAVNGINITQMNHIEIVKLIKESGNSITLTIGSPFIDLVDNGNIHMHQQSVMCSNGNGGYMSSPNEQQQQQQLITSNGIKSQIDFGSKLQNGNGRQFVISPTPVQTKAIINQNEYHVIELRKHQTGGFGFSIRGGKEFNIPLFVLKLADQGPAALDGRLEVGDQILEINGFDAYNMTHSEAIERIKTSGQSVTLLIRRTGMPPPSITDIIAANATAAVVNAQQQQQQQPLIPSISSSNLNNNELQLRSKSPYLQQQQQQQQQQHFKHFNSSGTLINRNF